MDKKSIGNLGNKKQDKKSGENTSERDNRKCFHCHEPGHSKKNCAKWKALKNKYQNTTTGNRPDQVNQTEKEKDDTGYESGEALSVTSANISLDWVIDSGFSFHMSHIRDWIQDFRKGVLCY